MGDPKQSIYRFRRADVRLYEGIKRRLQDRGTAILELGRSFRANAEIQRFVNEAFAPLMDGDSEAGRPSYLPLGESRQAIAGQPAVVALPVPSPYKWKYLSQRAIEESQPKAVAAYCDWLINESGFTVERGGEQVPLAEGDICILFRRYLSWGRDVTRPYTQALEDRGITHLLIGARTFHQREEVETLRAALLAIERPDEELVCFATLRGSLFSFSDELLLRYRAAVGGFSAFAWQRYKKQRSSASEAAQQDQAQTAEHLATEGADELEAVGEVLEILVKLHRLRNRRAVVETVQELLNTTRARAGFALRPAGHQVLANVERICELARAYEMNDGRSFRGFVERLEAQASRPTSAEAPVVEDGAEGVRIMTVHAAKGLEFRVVILADMTANIAIREPDSAVDADAGLCATKLLGCAPLDLIQRMDVEKERDHAEGVRVAYVAATRARDLLVVPAVGDEARPGWLEPLNAALHPEHRRNAQPSPGCPPFGPRSVLARPTELEDPREAALQDAMGAEDPSVQPGLHPFDGEFGRYSVTWWDPSVLSLDVRREVGLAREELLSPKVLKQFEGAETEPVAAPAVERNLERYRSWQAKRADMVSRGSVASREVIAVTALEADPPGGIRPIAIETIRSTESQRPSGLRFGELVHSVLQLLNLRLPESEVVEQARSLSAMIGRNIGATDRECEAAVEAVAELAESPLGAILRTATGVWREFALSAQVLMTDDEGKTKTVMVDAVIDLMFTTETEIVVVDFKTDRALLNAETSASEASVPVGVTPDDSTPIPSKVSPSDTGFAESDALGRDAMAKYSRQLSWYAELLESSGNLESLLKGLYGAPNEQELVLRLVQI